MKKTTVKERIIEVTAHLFYTQGYNRTGINQIIKESDVARASLYNHFNSKTDLLIAYLQQANEKNISELKEFIKPFSNPKEKLLAVIDYRLSLQEKFGFGGCRFAKVSLEISKEEEQRVLEITNSNKERFKKVIKELVSQVNHKQILTDDLMTETIFLLIEGSSVNGAMTQSSMAMKKAKKIVNSLL